MESGFLFLAASSVPEKPRWIIQELSNASPAGVLALMDSKDRIINAVAVWAGKGADNLPVVLLIPIIRCTLLADRNRLNNCNTGLHKVFIKSKSIIDIQMLHNCKTGHISKTELFIFVFLIFLPSVFKIIGVNMDNIDIFTG